MTNEIKNVPELRFPEFKEVWEDKILDEVSTFSKGKGISKNDLSKDGTPCILYGELYTTYDFIINKIKSKTLLETKNLVKGKKNQVLIPSSGETPLDIATAAVINTTEDMLLGGDINVLTPDQNYDGKFISLSINGKNKSNLSKYAQGKSVVHLYNNDIKKLKIKFPVKNSEQQKISAFFSKLDRQIELEEQKLSLLEEQKKGYMQKIFSQKLRFKDENGEDYPEWNITTIEKIAKVSKGFTPSTKDINLWQNDNKNWLSIAGMSDKYIYEGNKGISSAGEGKHKKVNEDTLIMSFKLTLGKVAIVKTPIYTNEAICHFEWKTNQIKTDYMYYYLSFTNIKSFGAQAVKGITLNNDSINSIVIKLPEFLEQNKIGNFFNKCDELIEKQNQKIELMKERKKSFLQKMFL